MGGAEEVCMGMHGCAWGWVGVTGVAAGVCTLGWTGEVLCVCKRWRRSARVERHLFDSLGEVSWGTGGYISVGFALETLVHAAGLCDRAPQYGSAAGSSSGRLLRINDVDVSKQDV
eukprot:scaffold47310_cov66-Phaeocystis_antarctica.AAC.2